MIARDASRTLTKLAKGYPVVVLTGPRQSGKTTLAKAAFPRKRYVSLENPDERSFALQDPRGFLARLPNGAIIDEAQHAPDLFSYIQTLVDASGKPGLFILTGSQNFGLITSITQSLAGRAAIVQLLPFSMAELRAAKRLPRDLDRVLLQGLYPPIHDRRVDPVAWHASYLLTYVERDVRQIVNIQNLTLFQRFVRLCAARTGQMLNLSSLATDCGISHSVTRSWLSVLQASYIAFLLPPHYHNFGKRLVKTPKLYFHDPGLAAALLGIQDQGHLEIHPARPALFETLVVNEFLKRRFNAALLSNLYFWRDNIGTEIDLVLEEGAKLLPVEIKSGRTINDDFFSSLRKWQKYAGAQSGPMSLVYGGNESYLRQEIRVQSWRSL